MRFQLGQICDVVKSVVPEEMWGADHREVEEAEHSGALDVGVDPSMTLTTAPTTRPSSPTRTMTFDDGLDWRYRGRSRDVHRVIGSRSKRLEEGVAMADLELGKKASGIAEGLGYYPASLAPVAFERCHLLSGIAKCGICGSALYGQPPYSSCAGGRPARPGRSP